jgi:hypothetical protein
MTLIKTCGRLGRAERLKSQAKEYEVYFRGFFFYLPKIAAALTKTLKKPGLSDIFQAITVIHPRRKLVHP